MNDLILIVELTMLFIAIAFIFITAIAIGYMAWDAHMKRRV